MPINLGLGLSLGALGRGEDPIVAWNAVNIFGPGHAGGGMAVSAGAPIVKTFSFVNKSGAAITKASLCLAGKRKTNSTTDPWVNVGNDTPLTANIEYPVGVTTTDMSKSASTNLTVPDGQLYETDGVTLNAEIPAGATFNVNMTATTANGLNYINSTATHAGFGLFGIRTHARRSTITQPVQATGDSIATNNSAVYATAAAYVGIPSMQISISGSRAQTFGESSAADFAVEVAMAVMLGSSEIDSNHGTNDIGLGTSAATILSYLSAMRTLALASGVEFVPSTILPKTTPTTVTPSAMVSSGTTITATVPDATKFIVGKPYNISGASQAEYNGVKFCTARNTGANTVDFCFEGSGTTPATGTIVIAAGQATATDGWTSAELQTAATGYEAGGSSVRGTLNAAIRNSANFTRYFEFGDATEPTRDIGRYAIGGEKTELQASQLCTVSNGISATRFVCDWSGPTGSMSAGTVQFITGALAGKTRLGSSNTNGDITVSSTFGATPSIGDTCYVISSSMRIPDSDSLHPRIATGTVGAATYRGGQATIVNAAITYYQAL